MTINLELHPIQIDILKVLLFNPVSSFSQMNSTKISSDHFNFHLKRLIDLGCVVKNKEGLYILTAEGKEFANRLDTNENKIERQAKIGALVCPIRLVNNQIEYLLQQRLKQPYFGYWGLLGGKIKWGETTVDAALRELKEETGLTAQVELVGIKHKTDYDENKKLLEDKYFYLHKAINIEGELIENFEGGKNKWMSPKQILETKNLFTDVEESLDMINSTTLCFVEKKYTAYGY